MRENGNGALYAGKFLLIGTVHVCVHVCVQVDVYSTVLQCTDKFFLVYLHLFY